MLFIAPSRRGSMKSAAEQIVSLKLSDARYSKLASALLMPYRIKRLPSVSKLPRQSLYPVYKCFGHLLLANIFYAFSRRIAAALKIYPLRHSARFLAATYSLSTFFEYDCSPTLRFPNVRRLGAIFGKRLLAVFHFIFKFLNNYWQFFPFFKMFYFQTF